MKITIFPGKYHQNCGFSMAMLVYRRVNEIGLKKFISEMCWQKAQYFKIPFAGNAGNKRGGFPYHWLS